MVDRSIPVPPYQQIAEALRERMRSGQLAPGSRVPSINQLANDWDVAPDTARKALRLLKDQGWVQMVRGYGTFVADPEK